LAAGALWVDDAVGVMLDELQTLGTLDQTLVLFLMDHGMKGKGRLWEQGMRIATFARFPPAFAAGTVISEPVSNIDVRRPMRRPRAARLYRILPAHTPSPHSRV
jgi:arylsulfatase A-like enzyme